ncbi:MAG: DUF86 domain-containing protein [bacterium]
MNRTFRDYFDDIVSAIDAIEDFTRGMTQDSFVGDLKTVYATRKALEIMGEAAKTSLLRSGLNTQRCLGSKLRECVTF